MGTENKKEEKQTTDVISSAEKSIKAVTAFAELAAKIAIATGLVPEMRRAEYAKLIDSAFPTFIEEVEAVRRALKEIVEECDKQDRKRVVEHLKRLGTSDTWEKMERDMRMSAQLRSLHSRMHDFFGERADRIAGIDRKKLLKLIDEMIHATEGRMADYITQNLSSLAEKSTDVERGSLKLKSLGAALAAPIEELTKARTDLMRLELEARNAILAKRKRREKIPAGTVNRGERKRVAAHAD
jgi:hypothetical protein